jgi:hypothetical protein
MRPRPPCCGISHKKFVSGERREPSLVRRSARPHQRAAIRTGAGTDPELSEQLRACLGSLRLVRVADCFDALRAEKSVRTVNTTNNVPSNGLETASIDSGPVYVGLRRYSGAVAPASPNKRPRIAGAGRCVSCVAARLSIIVARHGKSPPRRHEELPPPWDRTPPVAQVGSSSGMRMKSCPTYVPSVRSGVTEEVDVTDRTPSAERR